MEYFEQMKPGAKGNYRLFQECHPHSHGALDLQTENWSSSNIYTKCISVSDFLHCDHWTTLQKILLCTYIKLNLFIQSHWIYMLLKKKKIKKTPFNKI